MDKLYIATEAGKILGISSSRVRMLARDRRVGQMLGNQWVFNQAEIERMKVRRDGRPPVTQISGNWLETLVKLEQEGVIEDVSDAYIVVRPREKHRVIAETRNPEGRKLYIVVDK